MINDRPKLLLWCLGAISTVLAIPLPSTYPENSQPHPNHTLHDAQNKTDSIALAHHCGSAYKDARLVARSDSSASQALRFQTTRSPPGKQERLENAVRNNRATLLRLSSSEREARGAAYNVERFERKLRGALAARAHAEILARTDSPNQAAKRLSQADRDVERAKRSLEDERTKIRNLNVAKRNHHLAVEEYAAASEALRRC